MKPMLQLQIEAADAAPVALPASELPAQSGVSAGEAGGWGWQLELTAQREGRWRCRLELTVPDAPTARAVALLARLGKLGARPRWLIPGNFYDENRPADSPRRYPRFGDDDDPWSASSWLFSAERAAAPYTSVLTEGWAAALVADSPYWRETPVGLGLDGVGDTSLLLRFPYAERPRSDAPCRGDGCAPAVAWQAARPGERLDFSFEVWLRPAAGGPLYPSLLRAPRLSARDPEPAALKPQLPMDAAAALLAEGLLRWHYDEERAVISETAAFDHYFRPSDRQTDRVAMHVAWLSGIPTAFALLRQGGAAEEAGRRVIDHIARAGLAPCGAFYAQWTPAGWDRCWYGPPEGAPPWLQATTSAEATLFLLQAIAHERQRGHDVPGWEAAARSNLEFALARQRADGALGSYYDMHSGEVTLWEGSAGMLWVAPLALGARVLGEERFLAAARSAASHYAPEVLGDRLRGAPEDVPLGPTSMDGYCALRAYLELYEASGEREWLEIARHAHDWTLTFRWRYNTRFDPRTLLGSVDFRTLGGDGASPSNQHLHVYGLITLPESLRLWRLTGDDLYFETARDLLGFARQTLVRVDGELNARRGMCTEQWYHVDWTHPKGSMLQLAHAWCNGLAIYGFQEARRLGELWLGERVYALEPGAVSRTSARIVELRNPFEESLNLRVRLLEPWRGLRVGDAALAVEADELGAYVELSLAAGGELRIELG
jgi:hypothetical protein